MSDLTGMTAMIRFSQREANHLLAIRSPLMTDEDLLRGDVNADVPAGPTIEDDE